MYPKQPLPSLRDSLLFIFLVAVYPFMSSLAFPLARTTLCMGSDLSSTSRKRRDFSRDRRLLQPPPLPSFPFPLSNHRSIRAGLEAARIEQEKKDNRKARFLVNTKGQRKKIR